MSDYYLCDYCMGNLSDPIWNMPEFQSLPIGECECDWHGHIEKKIMHDHHGRGGKRYDEPKDVCEHYVARRREACTERT